MRHVRLLLLAVVWLLSSSALARAQEKSTDTSQFKDPGGRPLEDWIKDIHSKDRSRAEAAVRTILLYPPDRAYQAVPALLIELKRVPLDVSLRVNIPLALGVILTNSKGAEPKHLQDAVTQITKLLSDSQSIVRYRAAEALGNLGPEARNTATMTQLLGLLRDATTWEIRQVAAVALGRIGHDPKQGAHPLVLDALFKRLDDPASQVRLAAVHSLTYIGPPADDKVRVALMNAMMPVASRDPEPAVQIWAAMCMMSLHNAPEPQILGFITGHLKSKDPFLQVQAIQAIGTVGGNKAKSAVPMLIKNLEPNVLPGVKGASIWALGRIGVWASDAIPALQKISTDPKEHEPVKKNALEAIDLLQGKERKK